MAYGRSSSIPTTLKRSSLPCPSPYSSCHLTRVRRKCTLRIPLPSFNGPSLLKIILKVRLFPFTAHGRLNAVTSRPGSATPSPSSTPPAKNSPSAATHQRQATRVGAALRSPSCASQHSAPSGAPRWTIQTTARCLRRSTVRRQSRTGRSCTFLSNEIILMEDGMTDSYRLSHIVKTMRALQSSTKTSLRIDSEGLLSLQFLMPSPKPKGGSADAFIEFRVRASPFLACHDLSLPASGSGRRDIAPGSLVLTT